MEKQLCVIGGGYWGQNHIRTLSQMGNLGGIVEADKERLDKLISQYHVLGFTDVNKAIEQKFDGYVVATPAQTHYSIGKLLLESGQNVLLEKPMTLSSQHSKELVEIAERTQAHLMVGHLLLFHPAIKRMKELIDGGIIGKLRYLYSNRLNMGKVRTEEDVFWSFAPHDISVLNYLVGAPAIQVVAKGSQFMQSEISDVVMAQFTYPENIQAHIFVSWIHPFKEQRLVLIGSKGMLSFEDSSSEKNIIHYNKCVDWVNGQPFISEVPEEVIPYEKALPLAEELKYLMGHLDSAIEIANGQSGHEVVKVLETVHDQIAST